MRQLLPPTTAPIEPADLLASYEGDRPARPDRPWVLVNMVTSLDGAISVEGRSGGLSSAADRAAFHAIRAQPDVILVGSGTVLAENYHPPTAASDVESRRSARGQSPVPRLAIVSASLRLGPDLPVFADPTRRPMILTVHDADPARRAVLGPVADLVDAGTGSVDMVEALAALRRMGVDVVLCEGGPTLNASMAEIDAVDELCMTLAPTLAGGGASRLLADGPPLGRRFELVHVLEDDGTLLLRYRRATQP